MFYRLLLILAIASPVLADEANPKVKEYETTLEILRIQTTKGMQRVEDVFDEEAVKLKATLIGLLKQELDDALKAKNLDGSIELRDGIKELESYAPKLDEESGKVAPERKFDHSLVKSFDSRIKLLRLQATRAMSRMESGFEEEARKLRDELADSLMSDVDAAMEAKNLDSAIVLRELAKEVRGSNPKLNPTPSPAFAEEKRSVDLLSQVDVDTHKRAAKWESVDKGIVGTAIAKQVALLEVPFSPRRTFAIGFDVTRLSEARNGFLFRIPVGTGSFGFFVDQNSNGAPSTGIDSGAHNLIRVNGPAISQDQLAAIRCEVREDGISIAVDGKERLVWSGDPTKLTFDTFFNNNQIGNPESIYVGASHGTSYLISRIELFRANDASVQKDESESPLGSAEKARSKDLLSQVDVDTHKLVGNWDRVGKGIIGMGTFTPKQIAILEVPFFAQEKFSIEFDVKRISAYRNGFLVRIPVGTGSFKFYVDQNRDRVPFTGIDCGARDLIRVKGPVIDQGQLATIRCEVSKDKVTIMVDGKERVSWRGDPTQLMTKRFSSSDPSNSRGENLHLPNPNSIYVCASHDASYLISRIELFPAN